jgi:hypothetical protein
MDSENKTGRDGWVSFSGAKHKEVQDKRPSMTSLTRLRIVVFSFATEDISHDVRQHVVPRLSIQAQGQQLRKTPHSVTMTPR